MAEVCRMSLERLQEMGRTAVKLAVEYSPDACAKHILANLEKLLERDWTAKRWVSGHA
jgi:hypothetical protein